MELIDIVPEFNLYEEYWKIYTKQNALPPQYISGDSVVEKCIIGEGSSIYGEVYCSVIGCNVTIEKGAVVRDSIIMNNTVVGAGTQLNKAIVAENVVIGSNCKLGVGEEAVSEYDSRIYTDGLVTLGEKTVIPDNVSIGKNTVIFGETTPEDYPDNWLASGKAIIKEGDQV